MQSNCALLGYRRDIDGLRAIAVLSVIAFHAFPQLLPSGFIGVDIFFVISGYLISRNIFTELLQNNFSFWVFYKRRIKRIFPAAIVVLFSVFVFSCITLPAEEFKEISKFIASSAAFIANLALYTEVNYFCAGADNPLLHFWSLGIEEQFYLFFPLILFFSFRKNTFLFFLILTLFSFLLDIIFTYKISQTAAFFMPFTRAWELFTGALIAYIHVIPMREREREREREEHCLLMNFLSLIGAALLAIAFYRISSDTQSPALRAGIPVAGTALCIFAGKNTAVSKLLSFQPLVFIGAMSFSLYLWHWPVFVMEYLLFISSNKVISLIIIFLLSFATYIFIECPLRYNGNSNKKSIILLCTMFIIAAIGITTFIYNGFPHNPFNTITENMKSEIGHKEFFSYTTNKFFEGSPKKLYNEALTWKKFVRCKKSKNNDTIDIAIIGDSHAEHIFPGLAESLPQKNIAYYINSDIPYLENALFKDIFEYIKDSKTISTVIITAWWQGRLRSLPKNSSLFISLDKLVKFFLHSGKKVYLIDDAPTLPFHARFCKYKNLFTPPVCTFPSSDNSDNYKKYISDLDRVAKENDGVELITINKYFCDDAICHIAHDGSILFRDRDHLSLYGSKYIGNKIVKDNPALFNEF